MLKPLSNDIYKVRVPVMATLNAVDMHFGIRVNYAKNEQGRTVNDKYGNKEWTTTWLTLDKLIEIFDNGFPIMIVDKEDINTIYNELERYVTDLGRLEEISVNGRALYDERVNVISKFVSEIFGHNKGEILKEAYNIQYMGKNVAKDTISISDTMAAVEKIDNIKVVKPLSGNNPFEKPTVEQMNEPLIPANTNMEILTYRPPVILNNPVVTYDNNQGDPYIQQIDALPNFGVGNTVPSNNTSYRKSFKI